MTNRDRRHSATKAAKKPAAATTTSTSRHRGGLSKRGRHVIPARNPQKPPRPPRKVALQLGANQKKRLITLEG